MEDLKQALDNLRASLQELQQGIAEVRQAMTNEHPNVTTANDILRKEGYSPEHESKLAQHGILEATTRQQIVDAMYQLIDHRRDSSIHYS